MKKPSLMLKDFKKNELPKKHYKMIMGGEEPKIDPSILAKIDPPPITIKPPGQS